MNDPNPPQVTIIGSGIQVRHQREDGMYIGFEEAYNRGERGWRGGYNRDKKCVLKCVNRNYFNYSLLTIHTEFVRVEDKF